LRNPKLALRRLAVVKEAGRDVARLWNLVIDRPEALEAASSYGSDWCSLDESIVKECSGEADARGGRAQG